MYTSNQWKLVKVEESSGGWDGGWWRSAALVSVGGGGRQKPAQSEQNRGYRGGRAEHGGDDWTPASSAVEAATSGGWSERRQVAGRRQQVAAVSVRGRKQRGCEGFTGRGAEEQRLGLLLGWFLYLTLICLIFSFYFWLAFPSLFLAHWMAWVPYIYS